MVICWPGVSVDVIFSNEEADKLSTHSREYEVSRAGMGIVQAHSVEANSNQTDARESLSYPAR